MTVLRVLIPIGIAAGLWWLIFRLAPPAVLNSTSNPCRPTAAEQAATEIAGTGDDEATPTPVNRPVITTELVVLAGDRDVPTLHPSLVFRAPADNQSELNAFLSASLTEATPDPSLPLDKRSAYRTMLEQLLANDAGVTDQHDIGIFNAPEDVPKVRLLGGQESVARARVDELLRIDEPPIVGLGKDGTVILVVPKVPEVLADTSLQVESDLSSSDPDRFLVGDPRDALAGGWEITSDGRYVQFSITGRPPANTAWDVGVCAEGLDIVSAALTVAATLAPSPSAESQATPATPVTAAVPEIEATPTTPEEAATAGTPMAQTSPNGAATPSPAAGADALPTPVFSDPKFQNATSVRWWIQPDAEPPDVQVAVVARASPLMVAGNWLLSGWPRALLTALAYAVPAILLAVGVTRIPSFPECGPKLRSARDRLSALLWSVVRLTAAAMLSYILVASRTQGDSLIPREWMPAGLRLVAVIAVAVIGIGLLGRVQVSWLTRAWQSGKQRAKASEGAGKGSAVAGVVSGATSVGTTARRAEATVRTQAIKRGGLARQLPAEVALTLITIAAIVACFEYLQNRVVCPLILKEIFPSGFCPSISDDDIRILLSPALIVAGCTMFLLTAIQAWWYRPPRALRSWPVMSLPAVGAISLLACVLRFEADEATGKSGLFWLVVKGTLVPAWVTICLVVGLLFFIVGLASQPIVKLVPERVRRTLQPLHLGTVVLLALPVILLQWMWAMYSRETVWWHTLVEAHPIENLSDLFRLRLVSRLAVYPLSFFPSLSELLLVLGLIGFIGVLYATGSGNRPDQFLAAHQHWVRLVLAGLFAVFVIGYGGQILGLRAPVALLLGLLLLPLAWSFPEPVKVDKPAPVAPAQKGTAANTSVGNAAAAQKQAETEAQEEAKREAAERELRELLAHGLPQSWWKNGVQAVSLGSRLAVLPIAYFVFVFFTSHGPSRWALSTPFAFTGFVSMIVNEVAFWLVSAFVFGCLYPYLIGLNGLVKGVVLAAVYVAAHAGAALLGIPGNTLWQVRSFQLLLFLMLLGAWMDHVALGNPPIDWQKPFHRYWKADLSTALFSQFLPLITALVGVIVQLTNDQTHEATVSLVSGEARQAIEAFLGTGK